MAAPPAPLVDAHLHVADPALPGSKPLPPWLAQPPRAARELARALDAAGIGAALAMGSLRVDDDDPLGLAGSRAVAARLPGRLQLAGTADPRRGRDRAHLARVAAELASGGVAALKCYLGYLHRPPDDPGYRPYFELAAEHRVPVVLHTGDCYARGAKVAFAHPRALDAVAVDHPACRFVLAHFGCPWFLDAAEVLYKNDNVWADLSGWLVGAEVDDPAARRWLGRHFPDAMDYCGRWDRLLFGSDWPLVDIRAYRAALEAWLPPDARAAVLGGTARALFGFAGDPPPSAPRGA